ncbi:ead/Ea22-like family protein [Escherichia coli]|nr:ead/Ea22-like family protein [Escherichia coli]MCT6806345.1 ead/Ea22-like family protein [Escherichia coli]
MREVNYEALREAAQNYQSTLAWYQAIPDSPNAERDCDAALAAFKRHIRHREADIIADLLDGLEEAKSQLNEQREYYEGVISDGSKRIAELEKIATDYALKFQKAQDALKYAVLLRKSGQEAREIKPAKGEVLVVVSGFTGCGKSAIAGEIEIAMKSIGVPVKWTNGDAEKRMTGADWLTAIEMYKPTVRIVEVNVPRAAGIRIKGGE